MQFKLDRRCAKDKSIIKRRARGGRGFPCARPQLYPALAVLLLIQAGFAALAQSEAVPPVEFAREDPTKIMTTEACRECHIAEYDVWRNTPHAKGFKSLHRMQGAQDIAERMGFNLIKRESLCLTCHYTTELKRGTLLAVSGVSCESCHGAAKDWMDIHNKYGGEGVTWDKETPEHKAERIEKCRELGMRRPSDLYAVASRCFQCHTVPEEKLVDVGGHGTGSAGFEFVKWSQGEIRHNFLQSFLTGDGTVNAERPMKRKRVMYVLGRALDLEYSLRGVSEASDSGRYFKAMSRRLRNAISEVRAIDRRSEIQEVSQMLAVARKVKALPNEKESLVKAAEAIGELSKKFLTEHDGSRLEALDPLVLGTAEDEPEAPEEDGDGIDQSDSPSGNETAPPTEPGGASTGTTSADQPPAPRDTAAQAPISGGAAPVKTGVVGTSRTYLRAKSDHQTIGPGKCSSCHRHEKQSSWWFDDKHYTAADPFFERSPKAVKIARLYGIKPDDMARGRFLCMDCHGTVVSGRESREVNDGVGCESCHGPAADYLEPHQEGEPEQGLQRPGYVKALTLGMKELRKVAVAAENCASCHYITDPRLLSSGHPSGKDWGFVDSFAKIKHWEHDSPDNGTLLNAYRAVLGKRGAVPDVQVATPIETPSPSPSPAGQAESKTAGSTAGAVRTVRTATPVVVPSEDKPERVSVSVPRPVVNPRPASSGEPVKVELSDFPEIDEHTAIEEILLLLKRRLEALHDQVNRKRSP